MVQILRAGHLLFPAGQGLLVLLGRGHIVPVLGHERVVLGLVGHRIEVQIQTRHLVLHRHHESLGQLVGERHVEAGQVVGLDEILQLLGIEDVGGIAPHQKIAGVHERVGVRLARTGVEVAHGVAQEVGVVRQRVLHGLVLAEVGHNGVGGARAVVLAGGQLHGVALVGALDAEQVVVRRLGQGGVARGGLQNGLGDHHRGVQVAVGGDMARRFAHERDELLGGKILAVVAGHVGRVIHMGERDGGHRDGHLLQRRLGLALVHGRRMTGIGHPAGPVEAGLLDALVHGIVGRGVVGLRRGINRIGVARIGIHHRGCGLLGGGLGHGDRHVAGRIAQIDGLAGRRVGAHHRTGGRRLALHLHDKDAVGGNALGNQELLQLIPRQIEVRPRQHSAVIDHLARIPLVGIHRAVALARRTRNLGFGGGQRLVGTGVGNVSPLPFGAVGGRHVRALVRRAPVGAGALRRRLGRRRAVSAIGHLGNGRLGLGRRIFGRRLGLDRRGSSLGLGSRLGRRRTALDQRLHLNVLGLVGEDAVSLHQLQIGQGEALAAVDAVDEFLVALRQRSAALGADVVALAVVSVASLICRGNAAHRGNDQGSSRQKRHCVL